MSNIDPFERFASKLTNDELRQVRATMDELGVSRSDAMFHVMAALDYHRILYERVPAQIKEAGDNALEAVHEAARLQGEREFAHARASLAEDVATAARRLSETRDKMSLWIVAFFAIVLVLTATIGAFFIGRFSGDHAYRAATAEAVTWFNSADGQYAKYLSDHGVLHALQICRAQNRTLAIGPTKVRCGVMRTPMRDVKDYSALPASDAVPAR